MKDNIGKGEKIKDEIIRKITFCLLSAAAAATLLDLEPLPPLILSLIHCLTSGSRARISRDRRGSSKWAV